MAVIDEAIERGADLLICHHPLFFLFRARRLRTGRARRHRRQTVQPSLRSVGGHTNADAAWRGGRLLLTRSAWLISGLWCPSTTRGLHAASLGRVGLLEEPMTLERFRASRGAGAAGHESWCSGRRRPPVARAARRGAAGSGDLLFDEVRASGADVYVTSDLRHHPATDALEQARYEASLLSRGLAAPLPEIRERQGTPSPVRR